MSECGQGQKYLPLDKSNIERGVPGKTVEVGTIFTQA